MSSGGGGQLEALEIAKGHEPKLPTPLEEKEIALAAPERAVSADHETAESLTDSDISQEDLLKLRRVSGKLPWQSYTIAFVEFCERFSYYGTTVVFTNYIQQPLPPGSKTGAGFDKQSGGFGMGQRAAFALTTFNAFWSYVTPLVGGYIADEYWGRLKTIQAAIAVALVGHTILIISSIPPVIVHGDRAIGVFALGIVIMGVGTGGFKSNISPLIAEQYKETKKRIVTTDKGERVISDPVITISRIFMYFYLMINLGSLVGQIGMVYAEKYVGFWLSFTLPTIMFCLCPLVLFVCRKKYNTNPPTGSVTGKAFKLWKLANKGCWSINPVKTVNNFRSPDFWEKVKPSKFDQKPGWMTFDDHWVDEVRRGVKACTVFIWFPIYWLAYNQMTSNLTSQAATMELHGVPNDILNNLNPFALVISIPLFDQFLYPWLRARRIRFTPLKRIFTGFMTASVAMIVSMIIQIYIYRKSPCGYRANSCTEDEKPAPINVWAQTPAYVLIAWSEVFASITGLEYAFTKAPKNMRSLVMGLYLFANSVSSALAQALTALSEDPLLIWNYGVVAVLAGMAGVLFWILHRKLDAEEDTLNMIPDSSFKGRMRGLDEEIAEVEETVRHAKEHETTAPPAKVAE